MRKGIFILPPSSGRSGRRGRAVGDEELWICLFTSPGISLGWNQRQTEPPKANQSPVRHVHQLDPTPQSYMSIPNNTVSWGPSDQTYEPVGDTSHSRESSSLSGEPVDCGREVCNEVVLLFLEETGAGRPKVGCGHSCLGVLRL